MAYRCVAATVTGFVQQLAVGYVARGYYFYVSGWIPEGKDPARTDAKILNQYEISGSKWVRARRKRAGQANVHYLRYGRFFVIIANHGEQPFFGAEASQLRDVRVSPIRFMGYSIGCRQAGGEGAFRVSVRIQQETYHELKHRLEQSAVHRSADDLCRDLRTIPYEPYAPVRDQLRALVRAINRRRKEGGLEVLPASAYRQTRRPVKPFDARQG